MQHPTPTRFKNNYTDTIPGSTRDLLRWQWNARRKNLPPPPQIPTPIVTPNLQAIHGNAGAAMQPAITWIGHATMLVQASGLNVLTDPVFSERASPVQFAGPQRAQPPGVALADLPPIDVVVLSHNHYDHLDIHAVRALNLRAQGATLFIAPMGLKAWFAKQGIANVVELGWWQQHTVQGVEFHLTPVQHWSARGMGDRFHTLWGGWAVFGADFHWYFSGDTGYSQDFKDTRAHFKDRSPDGFDLALIAVGAYEPRWFMQNQHINPAEAVQIHRDLHAQRSVGVHWGTFNLTDEPLDQPPKDLAAARTAQGVADEDFFLMKIGETRSIPARHHHTTRKPAMTTPTTEPTIPHKDSLIEYPSRFPIKVMGEKVDGFVHAITTIAREFDHGYDVSTVELRESKGGKYLGLTITITATSREQLDGLYQTLSMHPLVKMVL